MAHTHAPTPTHPHAHTHAWRACNYAGNSGVEKGGPLGMLGRRMGMGMGVPTTETHICVSLVNRDKSLLRVIWTTCFASGVGTTKINIATCKYIFAYTYIYIPSAYVCAQRNKKRVFRIRKAVTRSQDLISCSHD